MKPSCFSIEFFIFSTQFSIMFCKFFLINILEEEALLQRYQSEVITVYINERLKDGKFKSDYNAIHL